MLGVNSIWKFSSNLSSGVVNLSGAAPLPYRDLAYQSPAKMNVNKSLIFPNNPLDLNISPYYPRTLARLAMTAALGVLPQSVGSVINDLLVEFSIYQSPASRSTYTLCENE